MKSRPTQFGVREHTASLRWHASRLAVDSLPSLSEILPRDSQHRASALVLASGPSERPESVTTDPLDAATGGRIANARSFANLYVCDEADPTPSETSLLPFS